jgi:hypothetical protein
MSVLFTNNATTTLASSITSGATSLTVATGKGALFPTITGTDYTMCTLQNIAGTTTEIVKVTARSGDVFTIVRAQEGTTASAFASGDKFELRVTAGEMTNLVGGSARGGSTDQVFYENDKTVTANYTITSGKNAMTAGPVTIATSITVTVPTGSRWVIV